MPSPIRPLSPTMRAVLAPVLDGIPPSQLVSNLNSENAQLRRDLKRAERDRDDHAATNDTAVEQLVFKIKEFTAFVDTVEKRLANQARPSSRRMEFDDLLCSDCQDDFVVGESDFCKRCEPRLPCGGDDV